MSEEAPKTEPATEQAPAAEDTSQQETQPEPEPSSDQQEEATPKTEEAPAGEDAAKPEGQGDTPPPEQQQQQQEEGEEEEEEDDDEEPEDGVPIALVTGASGYIGLHIVKQLLEQGRYRVRGTVRDKKREEKVKPLKDLVPDAKYPLRLVNADLEKPKGWAKAVKRCTYVFHVASPFFNHKPKHEDEFIRPAVEGTKNVLKACAEAGTVKRVVVTSSVAAVSSGVQGNPGNAADYVYTEKDWSDEATCGPYEKSKLRAERAAWDFVKELEEDKRFELVVMNPGYVQGPYLSKVSGQASSELLAPALNGTSPANVFFGIVDVRDVAAAHIAGMEKPEAAGNRYLLVNETIGYVDVNQAVAAEFKPQGYKVSVKPFSKATLFVGKLFNARAKAAYSILGKRLQWSNERMKSELGIEPHPMNETLLDTCYSLIELGLVKKTRGYLGHPSTRPEPEPEPEPAAAETTTEEPPKEQTTEGDKAEDTATTEEQTATEEPPKEEDKPATEEQTVTEEPPKEEDTPAAEEQATTEQTEAKEEDTTAEEPPVQQEEAEPSSPEPAAAEAGEEGTTAEGDQ